MKPLLMKVQAFGPYAGREIIDFRPALDSGLFGIYGATGSGKSSIFSAMTFALFGEAARSDQDIKSLRSHHADPGVTTEVELVFEIGSRRYRVVRCPEQLRPAKRGLGETREAPKASLFDVTGLDLDHLGENHTGKVLAEGKLKTVDEAIEHALGYGAAQFRQIVLLPQGKFETFLIADTKERMSILRDLFDVSIYRRLTEKLKDNAKNAEDEIRTARAVCQGRLKAEAFDTLEALAVGISEAKQRQKAIAETAIKAGQIRDAAEQAFQVAAQTDADFRAHIDAETQTQQLEAARPEMDAIAARLAGARVAQLLADADQAVVDGAVEAREAVQILEALGIELAKAIHAEQRAVQLLASLTDKQCETEAWRSSLRDLERHAETLAQAGPLQAAATEAEARAIAAVEASQQLKSRHTQLANQLKAEQLRLEEARSAASRRAALALSIAEAKAAFAAADAHEKASIQLTAANVELVRRQQDTLFSAQNLAVAEAAFHAAQAKLLDDQAMTIASRLIVGVPCPVCGSQHHPTPARGSPEAEAHGEMFKHAESEFETSKHAARDATGGLQLAEQRHRDRIDALANLAKPERPTREIATELSALQSELTGLGPLRDLDTVIALVRTSEQEAADALYAFETARDDATKNETARALAIRSREDALRLVPAELRAQDKLQAARKLLTARIAAYEAALQNAQTVRQQARDRLISAQRDQENAAANKLAADTRLQGAQAAMAARLAAHALTLATFMAHKADIPQVEAMTAQMDAWREQRSNAALRLREASERIAGLQRPDITGLKQSRDTAAATQKAAAESAIAATFRTRQLEGLQTNVAKEIERVNALETESGPLRTLADAFAGKSGPKVDLETFAIASMFNRVLEAANLRFGPMTRGRYSLVRDVHGGGNGRQGLGIAVDDAHTGRQRPTSTLSGGETFIAALALALGLSEVVESERGSVRLDTIFIDEGFGSLDSDNDAGTLEQVLQTLQDLVGRSRAVGLISHVPLVQQTIPNGFLITASPSGSRIEARS